MKAHGVLMTGFPGFIAGRLVREILARQKAKRHYYFLVQPHFIADATRVCEELAVEYVDFQDAWTLVEGDICRPNLGIETPILERLRDEVGDVWHLAAIYDLGVKLETAYAVNVEGTLHVLDFCESLKHLERHYYVSTCYVAGKRHGRVYEGELDCGQEFKNHYESTKFWAEKLVQHRQNRIPATIFRPAIVVGDSKTGQTVKGDGPYYMFQLLFRLPRWMPMTHVGQGDSTVNLVPVDFLVQAMAQLAIEKDSIGKVFQLADPHPYCAREIMEMSLKCLNRAPAVATISDSWVARLLNVDRVSKLVGIPPQVLPYFNHSVQFDVGNTLEFLTDSSLACPNLRDYLPNLIHFALDNPSIFTPVRA